MYFYFHLYRTSFYKFFFTLKYNIAICITTKIIDMIDITYEVIMSYKKNNNNNNNSQKKK